MPTQIVLTLALKSFRFWDFGGAKYIHVCMHTHRYIYIYVYIYIYTYIYILFGPMGSLGLWSVECFFRLALRVVPMLRGPLGLLKAFSGLGFRASGAFRGFTGFKSLELRAWDLEAL